MALLFNREHKDRLFKVVFGAPENKDNALSLYNALNGTDYQNSDDLIIYTIDNALYMGMHNDFSFILDGDINLYEQQSTYNPNMPLRGLFYLSKQYEKYVEEHNIDIFSSKRKMIPTPRYVVFYNGGTKIDERMIMKLSDSFINKSSDNEAYAPSLEVNTLVINLNVDNNRDLLERCRPLMDYANFVNRVKMNIDNGMKIESAIEEAVDYAIENDYLNGWFKIHRAEAIGMILTEYDEKKHMQQIADEYKELGRAEGIGKMSSLGQILLSENKTAELSKAFADSQYRDQLFKQYNI